MTTVYLNRVKHGTKANPKRLVFMLRWRKSDGRKSSRFLGDCATVTKR